MDIYLWQICYFSIECKFKILSKNFIYIFSMEILVSVHFDLVQPRLELGQTTDDLMLNHIYKDKSLCENIGRASLTKGNFFVDLCFSHETLLKTAFQYYTEVYGPFHDEMDKD